MVEIISECGGWMSKLLKGREGDVANISVVFVKSFKQ